MSFREYSDPAARGLLLSNEIFKQDTRLKELSAEKRKAERLVKVKPHVDAFFEFVHSLDMDKLSGKHEGCCCVCQESGKTFASLS